jgi:hypothetical protein
MALPVPRLAVVALIGVLALGGVAFAANATLGPKSTPVQQQPLVQQRAVLVVPDVMHQAFVFAKGEIEDAGMAWRVVGGIHGYPANTVASQSPAAGTRVYDTGAPLVTVHLAANPKYREKGTPQDISPYHATSVELADVASQPLPSAPAPAATTPAATTPAATTPAATTPTATTPAATTPATTPAPAAPATTAAPAAEHAPAVVHRTAVHPRVHVAAPVVKHARYPQVRPAAFTVAGAPKEPLNEMPLPDRAHLLGRWLDAHSRPTNASVRHWLYQNEWIVTGARFGWWRGAEALRILVAVDRRTVAVWGIGSKSEAVAAGALAEVEARSR